MSAQWLTRKAGAVPFQAPLDNSRGNAQSRFRPPLLELPHK